MATYSKRGQRPAESVIADGVISNIGACAAGQSHDGLCEVFSRIDDDMLGSEPFGDPRLLIARHSCNDRCTEMAGSLNQQLAYTAGCRMNKDSLARTDDMDVMQEKTRGDAFEKPGSGHVVGYIFREMNQQIGLHVATLRIRADRRTSPADMMEIRQLLEPAAAAFAATNASATELNAVREAHQIACDAKDMPEFEHWDAEFHHRVFACCRNDFLKEIHNLMRAIRNQSLWFEMKKRSFSEERRQRYCEEHQAILDALLRRDPDGAKTAMTIHLRTVEKNLLGR